MDLSLLQGRIMNNSRKVCEVMLSVFIFTAIAAVIQSANAGSSSDRTRASATRRAA